MGRLGRVSAVLGAGCTGWFARACYDQTSQPPPPAPAHEDVLRSTDGAVAVARSDVNRHQPYPGQFKAVWGSTPDLRYRLTRVFRRTVFTPRHLGTDASEARVEAFLASADGNGVVRSDDEVYAMLRDECTRTEENGKGQTIRGGTDDEKKWSLERGERRAAEIIRACKFAGIKLDTEDGARAYLDVGCGDGSITIALGRKICGSSPDAAIHGCDLAARESGLQHKGFRFHPFDRAGEPLPYPAEAFDVVSCLQVLHHANDPARLLSEIARVLKPGGVVVLREHDADTAGIRMLCDIEHGMWRVLRADAMASNPAALNGYFGSRYVDYNRLDRELRRLGLVPVLQLVHRTLWNPTNAGTLVYVKQASTPDVR